MCHMGRDASHGFQERQLLKSFFFAIKFSKFDYIIFAYLCKIFSFRQISTFFTICVIDHFTSVKCCYNQVYSRLLLVDVPKYDTMSSNAAAWRWWVDWSYNHTQSTAPTTHYLHAVPVSRTNLARH